MHVMYCFDLIREYFFFFNKQNKSLIAGLEPNEKFLSNPEVGNIFIDTIKDASKQ
jgi:hypothetical protein